MKYLNKEIEILRLAKNKKVLHLGCVGFTDLSTEERVKMAKDTLHYKLSKISNVTGIDYSKDVIKEYQKIGIFNNILIGDVEKLNEIDLDEKFDVIIIGDLIEHLSNPGQMLDGKKIFWSKYYWNYYYTKCLWIVEFYSLYF